MNAPAPEPEARHLKDLELATGPGPALIRHGQRYLRGCLNEEAAEAWTTALGRALQRHGALDRALLDICETYLEASRKGSDGDTGHPSGELTLKTGASSAVGRADADGRACSSQGVSGPRAGAP